MNTAGQHSSMLSNPAPIDTTNLQELQQNLRLNNALSLIGDQRLVQQWQIIVHHADSCRETACQIAQQAATARQQGQPSQLQELLLQRSKEADASLEQAIFQKSQFEKTILQQAAHHQKQHQALMVGGQQDAPSHQPNAQLDGAQENRQVIPFVQNGTIGVMNHRREQDLAIANAHVAFLLNLRTTDAARSEEHEQKVVKVVESIYERVIDRLCDDQREMRNLVREISVLNAARNNVGQMNNLDRMLNITVPNWFNDQGKTGGPVLGTSFGIDQILATLSSNNTQMMGEANKENGPMVAGDIVNQFQNVGAFTDQLPMTVGSSLNNTTNALGTDDAQLDINPLLAGSNNADVDSGSIANNLMDTSAPVNTTRISIGQSPNGANSSATLLNFEPFSKNGRIDFGAPLDYLKKISGPPFDSIQKDTGMIAGNVVETGVKSATQVVNTQNSSRVSDVHSISRREMDDRADANLNIPDARLSDEEQGSAGGPIRRSTRDRRAATPLGIVGRTAFGDHASTEITDIAVGSRDTTRKRGRSRGGHAASTPNENVFYDGKIIAKGRDYNPATGDFENFSCIVEGCMAESMRRRTIRKHYVWTHSPVVRSASMQ